ncbi:hypothetical protein ACJ41O_000965 [Fusarium nematophilum]
MSEAQDALLWKRRCFDRRPDRTPLTRKNLDDAQGLCRQLRSLLQKFNPDIDIDAELGKLNDSVDNGQLRDVQGMSEDAAAREEYEWHEPSQASPTDDASLSTHKDGMAILPNPNAGYLDAYFQLYNTSYPVIHEGTFRSEIANKNRLSASTPWRIIYYMVLAIGHWLLDSSQSLEQCPFYSAARSRISMQLLEAGSTRTVQGLLLMGNYLQKRDRPNTGYSIIGLAQRIAFGIGLHREKAAAEDSILLERHRQLFWIVYCFDSGFGITTGRPMAVLEGLIDQSLPRNIDYQDCSTMSPVPPVVDYPTTCSALIAQAKLAKIANEVYHEFLCAKTANKKVEYQVAEFMAQKLDEWRAALPPYFTSLDVPPWFVGPRSIVLWKEQNLRILLWRGSKMNHPYLQTRMDAKTRYLDAAMETIHSISSFCLSPQSNLHPGINWYATYFIFQAMLVVEASCLVKRTMGEDAAAGSDTWTSSASTARNCLEVLATRNRSAALCLELVESIRNSARSNGRDTPARQQDRVDDDAGLGGELPIFDPAEWASQMVDVATDPILRAMINEAFLDFEVFPTETVVHSPFAGTFEGELIL